MITPKPQIKLLTLLLLLLLASPSFGQRRAEKLMEQGRYGDASEKYESYIKRNPEDGLAHENLAVIYQRLNRYKESEQHFAKAYELKDLFVENHIRYAQILMKNGKRSEAAEQVKEYMIYEPESFLGRLILNSLEEMESWSSVPNAFEVYEFPQINSPYADFAPAIYRNGIVFSTERHEDLVNDNASEFNNQPYLAVFLAEFADKDFTSLEDIEPFLRNLNGDYHVGPVSIDTLRNRIYYSQVIPSFRRKDTAHLQLYTAKLHKEKRIKKDEPFFINSEEYSITHPHISKDGKKLFFSSDMPGGAGKLDLYYLERDSSSGSWSDPVRLSNAINTDLNEVFPYLYDENTLFFASDGHPGYGGLDLFLTRKKNGKWQKPVNLKDPINSSSDDFSLVFRNESVGYFASDRPGGKGKDDIYKFVQIADPEDNERTEVSGIFEYEDLPKDGVKLVLMDEFDNVLKFSTTDSNGRFEFGNMPPNSNYKIKVANMAEDSLERTNLFLTNQDGRKVILLDRQYTNEFVFRALPREEIASLPLLEEKDTKLGNYELFGQVYSKLPKDDYSGIKLLVIDDDGNLVTTVYTDSAGKYNIQNLSKKKQYVVEFQDDGSDLLASVFFDDGNEIKDVTFDSTTYFVFERLQDESFKRQLQQSVPARGYFSFNDARIKDVRLLLYDKERQLVAGSRTKDNGFFDLGMVKPKSAYFIEVPDSFSYAGSNTQILMVDQFGKQAMYAKRVSANFFQFGSSSFSAVAYAKESEYVVDGQIYESLPGDYSAATPVYAYDADGNLIEVAYTDAQGNFQFKSLKPDQSYVFKLSEDDSGDINVLLEGKNLDFKQLADFVYEKLNRDYLAKVDELAEGDTRLKEKVSGQVYQKLPGDYKGGVKVYAVDDSGNIIDSTYTDEYGNFEFKKLDREEDFTISLKEAKDTELNIAFFSSQGFYDESVKLDSNNEYRYSKVIMEAAFDLESDFDKEGVLEGQIFRLLPGDYAGGGKLIAINDKGIIIDIAILDEYGRFTFTKLSPDENYSLRLENVSDPDLKLTFFNQGEDSDDLSAEKDGDDIAFNLNNAKSGKTKLKKAEKVSYNSMPDRGGDVPVADHSIFYKPREWKLNSTDSLEVTSIASKIKDENQLFLSVTSHASHLETTYNNTYSAKRSTEVARIVYETGMPLERIQVRAMEDMMPVYDCPPGADCDSLEEAKNRRTDVRVIPEEEMPDSAFLTIFYRFSEWTLEDIYFDDLRNIVDSMKKDTTLIVMIDAYTDFYGSYENNLKISELRSRNISNWFELRGIDKKRIISGWHGESEFFGDTKIMYPVISEDKKLNRKAELRLIKPGTKQ